MSLLTLDRVTKDYGARRILQDVTLSVHAGERIGIVGANGAGKSTLLRILAGTEDFDAGQRQLARSITVGYMTQDLAWAPEQSGQDFLRAALAGVEAMAREIRALEADMASPAVYEDADRLAAVMERYGRLAAAFEQAGGYEAAARVRATAFGLGLNDTDLGKPVGALSGGQRVRLALARLLLSAPDVLLLDEPTNHLDMRATEWLEEFLQSFRNAVVVVSHDRYFLDAVTHKTWEVEGLAVVAYPAPFSQAMALKAERLERQREEYLRQHAEIARLEDFVRRYKAGQRTKQAQAREKRLARMERVERPRQGARGPRLELAPASRTGREAVALADLQKSYGTQAVLTGVSGLAERGERIGIVGPNGAGKTTLLRLIAGQERPDAGWVRLGEGVRLGYFSQDLDDLRPSATVLEELLSVRNIPVPAARSFLGRFLFSGEQVFAPVSTLSGGERNRLALAKLLLAAPNVLLLDEPTNHLDIFARTALEEALGEFEGTLLIVSHDRYFLDAVVQKIWALEGGRLTTHEGTYSAYRRWAREAAQAASQATSQPRAGSGNGQGAAARDGRFRPAPRSHRGAQGAGAPGAAERLEGEIAAWESRKQDLEALLADPALYADGERAREVVNAHREATDRLAELYARWEALIER